MSLLSIDPADGQVVERWPVAGAAEVEAALERSAAAFAGWSRASFEERAGVLRRASALLRAEAELHARLMAREMGKPLAQGRAEVEKCAWACEHYAAVAAGELADRPVATEGFASHVAFRPLGPVL
ncbi:MAG TPA: aldehyde dehydrogenase family protein, partial [Planctomycetota bacterium]|nr:aldehyde dehydrogenase family protein [Planctomycetota bacterium]